MSSGKCWRQRWCTVGEPIVSRELISRQADAAAAWAAANPGKPQPANPYCEHLEPERHREWAASFERQLQQHAVPDGEGSA